MPSSAWIAEPGASAAASDRNKRRVIDVISCLRHRFFLNDTATTETYTLSLHDALPISGRRSSTTQRPRPRTRFSAGGGFSSSSRRSEEHTSELQSRVDSVCRLLLE